MPALVSSNSRAVLDAAEIGWGDNRRRFDAKPIELRCIVQESGKAAEVRTPSIRAQRNLLTSVSDDELATADLASGMASIWVTRATVADTDTFRYQFLESMAYSLLEALHVVALHAACVQRNGRGVLLAGESGAGKSSLAYACARDGWIYVSDDSSSLFRRDETRIVTGAPRHFRFRGSAAGLFPEFEGLAATKSGSRKPSIEVPTESLPSIRTHGKAVSISSFCSTGPSAFMGVRRWCRSAAGGCSTFCFILSGPGELPANEERRHAIERLAGAETYEMHYSALGEAIALLMASPIGPHRKRRKHESNCNTGVSWFNGRSLGTGFIGIVVRGRSASDPHAWPEPPSRRAMKGPDSCGIRQRPLGTLSNGRTAARFLSVTAERQGYRTLSISRIAVEVNEQAILDLELIPGEQHDVVTVTAHVSEAQTEEPSIGYRLDSAVVSELPLDERNVSSLITLGPGAIPRQLGGFGHDLDNDVQAGSRGSVALNPPINGARPYMNVQLLDGATNTDRNTFAIVISPPLDSVREFRIQSSLASSAFAQGGGGVFDIVTKAGNNAFHGSLFEFLQNEDTDARNSSITRLCHGQLSGATSSEDRRQRLPVPSTFFFVAYEGLRGEAGKPGGKPFRARLCGRGRPLRRRAGFRPPELQLRRRAHALPGKYLPASRINPIAGAYLAQFEPLPNVPASTTGNYIDTTPSTNNNQNVKAHIDRDMKKAGVVFGRYTINNEIGGIGGSFPLRPTSEDVRAQQAVVGHTLAGTSWLNEARASFTRLRVFDVPLSAFHENTAKQLGLVNAPSDPASFGLPYFLIDNYATVTDDPTLPQTQRDNNWSATDSVSLVRGRHVLRMGAAWSRFQFDYVQSQSIRGRYEYTGAMTGNGTSGSGDPLADFLLGFPQNTQRTVGSALAHLRQSTYAAYFQDDWRLLTSLTINLGVRYEYFSPYKDARSQLLNVSYSQGTPALVPVAEATDPHAANFAPRVGLAWRLPHGLIGPGDAVFRAGYGIYFSPEIATESYDLLLNGITTQINTRRRNGEAHSDHAERISSDQHPGFPSYYGLDGNAAAPYVQQWNGGFQKELPRRRAL